MPSPFRGKGRLLLVLALVVTAAGGASFAFGAIGSSSTTGAINACEQPSNGSLRMVTATSACKSSETPVSWSVEGPAGPAGPSGPTGSAGPAGPTGADGPKGDTGSTGPAGPAGADGTKGDTGATGTAGPAGADGSNGDTGAQGDVGPTGPAGPKGDTGATGPQGPQGPPGSGGGSTIPGHVVTAGIVTLTDAETAVVTFPALPQGAWLLTLTGSATVLTGHPAVTVECTVDDNLVGNNMYSYTSAFPGDLRALAITRAISTPGGRDVHVFCRSQTVGTTAQVQSVVAVATPLSGNVVLNY